MPVELHSASVELLKNPTHIALLLFCLLELFTNFDVVGLTELGVQFSRADIVAP